jgi:LPS-assembly lipoprotein
MIRAAMAPPCAGTSLLTRYPAGQIFKTELEDKLNPEGLSTSNAEYHLHVDLAKSETPAVTTNSGITERLILHWDSSFKFYKTGSTKPILTGTLRRTSSYNAIINSNFATYEADEDAMKRTLQELAEQYVMRISNYLAAQPSGAGETLKRSLSESQANECALF